MTQVTSLGTKVHLKYDKTKLRTSYHSSNLYNTL